MSIDFLVDSEKITLIYIIGRGHSGSTLLDLLLGGHSDVTGLGELRWISNKKRARVNFLKGECTCGSPEVSKCIFWGSVEDRLQLDFGLSLDSLDLEAKEDQIFISHNMALFSAIRFVSGNAYLVDSSKDASRLSRLHSLCDSLNILSLYIVRNPCGVTYSHVKRGRDAKLWAKKYAAYSEKIHEVLAGREFHLVEYEQLSSSPRETLKVVMAYLGLKMEYKQLIVNNRFHHNIGGNGLRFQTPLQITPDEKWRKNITIWQKFTVFRYTRLHRLAISRLLRKGV